MSTDKVGVEAGKRVPQGFGMLSKRLKHITWPMTLWLTLCWVCVLTSVEPLVIISGLVLAVAAQMTFATGAGVRWRIRPLACLALIGRFLWDLVVAGVQVSWIVISGKPAHTDTVPVHIHSTLPAHVTLLIALVNLVPGTMVVTYDAAQNTLMLNVLNMEQMGGIAGVHRSVHVQEERLLKAVAGGLP